MVGGVKGELFDDLVALVEKGQEFGRSEVRRRDERVVECLFAEEEPACGNGGGVSSHQRTVAAHQRRVICKLTEKMVGLIYSSHKERDWRLLQILTT